jgi:predicted O-linked N-acetylglucosamine transferase (SPINDLY family)
MRTIPEVLAIAVQHHQAGQFEAAEQLYRQILEVMPDHADALHLLGVIGLQVGSYDFAVEHIRRAIKVNTFEPAFHNSLGSALQGQGKLGEAIDSFQHAVRLKPDFAEAHYNLGAVFMSQGKLEEAIISFGRTLQANPDQAKAHHALGIAHYKCKELDVAIACFRRAIELKADDTAAHIDLGTALYDQGNCEAAIACYGKALALNPDLAGAHNNLGNVFKNLGKLDQAIACFRRAVERMPESAEMQSNLGDALMDLENFDEAINCYRRALTTRPNFPECLNNIGHALQAQGRLEEAAASYRRARDLKPDYAKANWNLGNVLLMQGKSDEAIPCFLKAIQLKPDFAEAHNNLGNAYRDKHQLNEAIASYRRAVELSPDNADMHSNFGAVLRDQGQFDAAIASYRRALELNPNLLSAYSNLLYALYFCPRFDAAAIYDEHCRWNQQQAQPLTKLIWPHLNDANPDRRLRVGYVSPNFRRHAESFFLTPLFSAHDHKQFQIFCYSDVAMPDENTAKLRSYTDVWRETFGMSDEKLAERIRDDQIDVLVDLTMHMANGRPLVFARKPAPVQVCWLAYQGTTGLTTMDYRLTDPHLDPPGMFDRYYSEESFRLLDSFWCYDPLTNEPSVSPLPAPNRGHVTFGCLNSFAKTTDDVLSLWAGVLRAVARSRLLILAGEGSHRERTIEFLGREGIAPDRITFQSYLPRPEYLRLHHGIDIGLDTFPYNGQTTTLDAVWMGVPVITILGNTSVARAGASLMWNLGIPELVADSPDQFVSIAVALARDWKRLSDYRASLRERLQKSSLMDAPRFAKNVEAAYRTMWQRWCKTKLA